MIDVLQGAASGLGNLFIWQTFLFMMAGILIGMFFGLVPGLNGLIGMALLLPLAITMSPENAVAFLLGMYAVTTQTYAIPAVLIGVPGTSAAQATYLDGYPMARRGEAGRALSASYFASVVGTLIAAVGIILFLPLLKNIVDSFAAPENFAISLFGLVLAASLVGTSVLRGLMVAGMGLLLATVGYADHAREDRFTLDIIYLQSGIPVIPIALGLFALPEVLDLLLKRTSIAGSTDTLLRKGGAAAGLADVLKHRWLAVRTAVIGCVSGMIPGLGGAVAEWLCYGHAVQSAKDSSQFGKGDVRGVIAPECGVAAQKPGALIPTLAMGIPGNASMAVMMGALFIVGIRPGPTMLNENLPLTFQMIWTVVLANLIVAVLCLWVQRYLIRICLVRAEIVAPTIVCFMLTGAMLATYSMGDVVLFAVFGIVGYVFKHTDWPRVPLILAFVLGPLLENNLWITSLRYDVSIMWERPILIFVEIMTVLVLANSVRMRLRTRKDRLQPITAPDE